MFSNDCSNDSSFAADNVILEEIDRWYQTFTKSDRYCMWRCRYFEAQRLYDGVLTFGEGSKYVGEKDFLNRNGITASANVVMPIVNTVIGIEIQNRFRVKATVDDNTADGEELSEALSSYLLKIQMQEGCDQNFCSVLRDAVIGGLGWAELDYDSSDKIAKINRIEPSSIIFDCNDDTALLSNQKRIFRIMYMDTDDILKEFGEAAEVLDFNEDEWQQLRRELPSSIYDTDVTHRVIEYCERVLVDAWIGLRGSDGAQVTVLEEEHAALLSNVERTKAYVVCRTYICQGKILRRGVVEPCLINTELPYIPLVYQIDSFYNAPMGMVENLKSMQYGINVALSEYVSFSNGKLVFVKTNDEDVREIIRQHPEVFYRKNSVIPLQHDDQVVIDNWGKDMQVQAGVMQLFLELCKRTSGIEDESRGVPTNATSGIAQRLREQMSQRTISFVFDHFRQFKVRVGNLIIRQLQCSYAENILVKIGREEDGNTFIMNFAVSDDRGNLRIINDISVLKYHIVIEEIPVYNRSASAGRFELEQLLQNPAFEMIMYSTDLLGKWVDNPEKVQQSFFDGMAKKMQLQEEIEARQAARQQGLELQNGQLPQQPQLPQQ